MQGVGSSAIALALVEKEVASLKSQHAADAACMEDQADKLRKARDETERLAAQLVDVKNTARYNSWPGVSSSQHQLQEASQYCCI